MTVSFAQRHFRWNYRLWVVETSAWVCATSFIDSTTVLPVLVLALSKSPFLASLILSIRYIGQGWPQLIAASLVSGKPRKPLYLIAVTPGRLALLWPAIILLLGYRAPLITIPAILLAYLAFWVSEGFSLVPWTDMVGKTIPATRRGRLFATMHVIGGLLGIGAGFLIRMVLQSNRWLFPRGYGLLFLLAFVGAVISALALAILREPPSPPQEERYSTIALIKDIPNLLRSSPPLRLLVILQGLFGFSILPAPFYILFATQTLRHALPFAPGGESLGVGFFLAVQTSGLIVGNAVLGHVSDQYGNRLLLRVLALIQMFVPITALLAGGIAPHAPGWLLYLAFFPTFFGFGSLLGATWMAVTNYLLDVAPEHDRPAYIAVTNALNIPAVILPMLGGLLLHTLGYLVIFLIAAVVLCYAFLLTNKLQEPREVQHYHPHQVDTWE